MGIGTKSRHKDGRGNWSWRGLFWRQASNESVASTNDMITKHIRRFVVEHNTIVVQIVIHNQLLFCRVMLVFFLTILPSNLLTFRPAMRFRWKTSTLTT